jgi:lysophospholipase L1-like esterase
MALGDSHTPPTARLLGDLLAAGKADVALVGSQGTAPKMHEGHGGYTSARLEAGVRGWLDAAQPHFVTLMSGANDAFTSATPGEMVAALNSLVLTILMWRPTPRVDGGLRGLAIATIPRMGPPVSDATQTKIVTFNAGVRRLVSELQGEGAPVRLADVERAIGPSHLQPDGIHLTPEGYARVARVFYDTLRAPRVRAGGGSGFAFLFLAAALYAAFS